MFFSWQINRHRWIHCLVLLSRMMHCIFLFLLLRTRASNCATETQTLSSVIIVTISNPTNSLNQTIFTCFMSIIFAGISSVYLISSFRPVTARRHGRSPPGFLLLFLGGLVDWPAGSQFQANKFKEASLPNIPSVSRYFRYENLLCVCQSNDIYLRQKKNSMHTTFVFYRLPSWTCYVRPWYFQS